MRFLTSLAFRNLRTRLLRTLLTMGSIFLGVAVILAISITNASISDSLDAFFTDIAGAAHLAVESADENDGFHQRALEDVQSVPGVKFAAPSLTNPTVLLMGDDRASVTVHGIDPELDPQVRTHRVVAGRFLLGDEYAMVVVEDFADRHAIEVGQELQIPTEKGSEALTVVGILANEGPGRQAKVAIPLDTAQRIFGRGRDVDEIYVVAETEVAATAANLDALKAELQDTLGSDYQVAYPAARAKTVAEMIEGLQTGLSFFGVIALFVGAYLIFNTFSMTVIERTREIGLLRAVGTTKGQTFRLLLTEALVLGILGSALGVLGGIALAFPLMQMMTAVVGGLPLDEFTVPTSGISSSLIAGLSVTLVSAVIPALQASRITPIEALAVRSEARRGWLARWGWIIGAILTALSMVGLRVPFPPELADTAGNIPLLTFLIGVTMLVPGVVTLLERTGRRPLTLLYGNAGGVGSSNLQRAKGRTSLTVGALMVGVLMVVAVGTMTTAFTADASEWLEEAFGGDIFIQSNDPIRLVLMRDLEAVAGIETVTPVGWKETKLVGSTSGGAFTTRNSSLDMMVFEPQSYIQVGDFQFTSGQGDETAMIQRLAQGNAIFVSTVLAQKYELAKGDSVRLRTPRGEIDFEVAGVVNNYFQGGHMVFGSWQDLERYFRTNKAAFLIVKVAPGASITEAQTLIENEYGQRRHIWTESGEEARARWFNQMNQWMAMFDVLVLVGIIVAALGVINTLTMGVLERVREIGLLRAVGMTRWQVIKMILAEAVAMGVIGGLLGLGFGVFLSNGFLEGMAEATGWELDYLFPTTSLVTGMVLALVVSQLAAIYPAWRAARLHPVEALQYE